MNHIELLLKIPKVAHKVHVFVYIPCYMSVLIQSTYCTNKSCIYLFSIIHRERWKIERIKRVQPRICSQDERASYSFPPNNLLGIIFKCVISTRGLSTWCWFKRYRDKLWWWRVSFRWNGLLWFSSRNCVSSSASVIFFKNTYSDWQLLLLSLTCSNISVWRCKTSIIAYVVFRLCFVRDCSPQMSCVSHLGKLMQISADSNLFIAIFFLLRERYYQFFQLCFTRCFSMAINSVYS